jgi:hypothetical protein
MAISNDGITTIVLLCVLTGVATCVVVLRILRRRRRAFVGLDDWTIVFALGLVYAQDAGGFICESNSLSDFVRAVFILI